MKLALVACLLTLGARNHFIHVPALQRDANGALAGLRNCVRLEIASGAVVLLLSALLGALSMPMPHP